MTTHPNSARPIRVDPPIHAIRPCAIVYPIARSRLNDAAPKGNSAIVELRIHIDTNNVSACIVDPVSNDTHTIDTNDESPNILMSTNGWAHINAPNVISCSIMDANTDHATLVYARTTLLAALGLPGGRFDPPTLHRDT